MSGVFVCYRREAGVEAYSGRLRDALAAEFGDTAIFMDVDSVGPGEDWVKAIELALSECDVVLAVIHPGWVDDDRLADQNDVLRYELESALGRDLLVVPVLMDDASPPRQNQLPETLRTLARRQALPLRHSTWHTDLQPLVRAIRGRIGATRPPSGTEDAGAADLASRKVVATVDVGESPGWAVAVEGLVWVSNLGSGTVWMIDPASRNVVATVDVGGTRKSHKLTE